MTHTDFGYSFSDLSRERREREDQRKIAEENERLAYAAARDAETNVRMEYFKLMADDAKFDKQIDGEVVR